MQYGVCSEIKKMIEVKNIKQQKGIFITAGIVLLSLFAVFIADSFYPFGSGSVAALDLNSQYLPLLYRFYDIVTGTKNLAVDLHIGGGINLYSDSLTELLNPFNYILLLFKRADLYKAVNILLILYTLAASLSANLVLDRISKKTDSYLKIALSVTYGMSYYMAYQYEIIRWMYIVVLFPFLYLALLRLLEDKKPLAFIFLLAYIFVLSLQFGIQLCMFSFVYSICYILNENRDGTKTAVDAHKCLLIGISLIAAVLLSGFSTYPAITNILSSARSTQNSSILTVITHHGLDNLPERLLEISNPVVLGMFAATVFVLKKDTIKTLKRIKPVAAALIAMIITVIIEPVNLLWHLGSYQCFPVRYAYCVVWLGIVLVTDLINECINKEKAQDKKSQNVIISCVCFVAGLALISYVYLKRLMFSQAFATLDISGMCKKETLLIYIIALIVSGLVSIVMFTVLKRSKNTIFCIDTVFLSALMGMIWFMAVLWPQTSQARAINESNYLKMNSIYVKEKESVYTCHEREEQDEILNKALVSGRYSMSAYVPSGESREYVDTMNGLGYETPWISVTSYGGSKLSDTLLGLEEGFDGAINVSKEEFDNIRDVTDFSSLINEKKPVTLVFDNRKGDVIIKSEESLSGYVLLPMAYIKGWNSLQARVCDYLGGLLAVEINDSADQIVLDYSVPGLFAGSVMSVMGLSLILLLILLLNKHTVLDRIAKPVYMAVAVLFILVMYILPSIGLVVFMGAKAAKKDLTPYLEISRVEDTNVHTLLSQTVSEDGIHVLIGRNNLMNDKGVKVTSSDDESGYYRAAKASDGIIDKESRWSSVNDWDNNDHFLQADFKNTRNIQAVKIYWERTNACEYCIEVSQDGINWTKASQFNEPASSNPQIIYYEEALKARFLRLHITDVTKNEEDATLYYQNVSVYELEVYDDECDSFVIERPKLTDGTNRQVPVPSVPDGYVLKVGGVNYDNLLHEKKTFADTVAAVEINLGYELYYGYQKWDIEGFDIVLPASDNSMGDELKFKDVNVKEWKKENGEFSFDNRDSLKDALNNRENDALLDVSINESDYLGEEGYEIKIDNDKISLTANTDRGIYWGRVTLSHMIKENDSSWECGIIRDYPEYAVRGFVLDVARRPVSMDMLYRMLDTLADNYMNTFQIHLSDNAIISSSEYDGTVEGARKLFSAYRLDSSISAGDERLTSEFYYTDEEFRKFIADAKKMGIDVVPEIDTPAHSLAITKLFPELGYDDYPELADTLDVSKPEVLEFATNLWSEYLTGNDPLFKECRVLHLGTDEFFGDNAAYSKYVAKLCRSIKAMSEDKTIRLWGSISYNQMDTASIDKNVQMMVWSAIWSDPLKVYNSGFGIINCISSNLYIIVGSGSDRLDMDNLKNRWEPNLFYDEDTYEEIPAWSPKMLGACYSMWNENYCQGDETVDDDGIFDRFSEPVGVISGKLWNRE